MGGIRDATGPENRAGSVKLPLGYCNSVFTDSLSLPSDAMRALEGLPSVALA